MGANYLIPGGVVKSTARFPAVQEVGWLQQFPFPTVVRKLQSPLIASANRTIPAAIPAMAAESTGTLAEGFSRDWYNRIHVTPNKVDVGNLITTQVKDVKVWNAYFQPKTLAQVLESADAGTTLSQPTAAPFAFKPLQEVTYGLSVSPNGPPKVESEYLFDFVFTTIKLTVTGNRIVIWPFAPQEAVVESLEWKTDILRAKAREQRIALRQEPRQAFSFTHFMEPSQATRGRAMAVGWAHRQFGVPVWPDATYVGTVPEGTMSLQVDTSIADYREGETALVWKSDTEYSAVGIASVSSGTVTFKNPISTTLVGAFVMPLRYARAGMFKMEKGGNGLIRTSVDFNVLYNKDLGASIGLPTLEGLEVLTDLMFKVGSFDETIEKKVTTIDNGFGFVVADALYSNTDQTFMVSWDFTNRVDQWRVRRWLHSLKGKQKTFWLPTTHNDLTLVLDAPDASQQSIVVKSIGYALYYSDHALRIKRKSGVVTYHKVTGGTTDGVNDTLSFTAAIGTPVLRNDVESICFMHKVRLDSDRVEINHSNGTHSSIKVSVREVRA